METRYIDFGRTDANRVASFSNGAELWQGGLPPIGRKLHDLRFNVVVLCAMEYQPPAKDFPGVQVIHAPNDDAPLAEGGKVEGARKASKLVAEALRRGDRVLVTCAAGLNRSGLVSALALMRVRPQASADAVVRALRKARGFWALSNRDFEGVVRGIDKARNEARRKTAV